MKETIAKEVYADAMTHGNLPASVSVFLSQWVPWMFRKIKRQREEIKCLRNMLDTPPLT